MWQCHVSSSECRCYRLKGFSLLKRFPLSAGASGRLLEQPVGDWLEHVGLPQYESKLLLNGFDDLRYMVSLSPSLLDDASGALPPSSGDGSCSCPSFHVCVWANYLVLHLPLFSISLSVST